MGLTAMALAYRIIVVEAGGIKQIGEPLKLFDAPPTNSSRGSSTLGAVDEKRVDQIVVYKIDRMTRSLADFAKLVDRLDAAEASFVSVTQSFNTATSMGRLTLNVLLSFAQFEREVTAERIRDKIAASKRKGLWMGGNVPLGYQADGRTLEIDEAEAATIRRLFDLYLNHGSIREAKERAEDLGLRSRLRKRAGGRIFGGKDLRSGPRLSHPEQSDLCWAHSSQGSGL